MEGCSFIVTTKALERSVDEVLAEPTATAGTVLTDGLATMETLSDLCELTRVSQPIPSASDDGSFSHRVDRTVVEALETLYDREMLEPDDVPAPHFSQAVDCGRLTVVGRSVRVPLDRVGPAALNWPLVFAFVRDRLETIRTKSDRVRDRVAASPEGGTVYERVWRSVSETLEDLGAVLSRTLARHRWIAYVAKRPDERPMSFGSWVAESLDT